MRDVYMSKLDSTWDALNLWRTITMRMLAEKDMDLSTRQVGIMLTVYLTQPPHTVKNLSERLNISKPSVCRAIDTLSAHNLIKRKKDEDDNRVVHIQRTVRGSVYLSELSDIILSVTKRELPPEYQASPMIIDKIPA